MLLRMTLLACLALLLARPVILASSYNPFATATPADIAVVLDHSLSMGRLSGDQTLFDRAAADLDQIVSQMRPADTLSVILAEHTPRDLAPHRAHPGPEFADLRQRLRQLPPGLTDCSIPDALAKAREILINGANRRKLIFVLSDQQRSNWQLTDDAAWRTALGNRVSGPDRDILVFALPVPATATTPDLAVTGLNVAPGFIGLNRPVTVAATITNLGPGDMSATSAHLLINGHPAAVQTVAALPARQSQTLRFDYAFSEPGSHWVKVQTDAVNALDADNAMLAPVEVWPRLPVLIVDGALTPVAGFPSSRFLQAAMQPVDIALEPTTLVQPQVVNLATAAIRLSSSKSTTFLNDFPIVILNDVPTLPAAMIDRLTDHVRAGGGLWIILGPRTQPAFFNNTLAKTPLFPAHIQAQSAASPPGSVGIDVRFPDNPMVSLLTESERNAFAGTLLSRWWRVTPVDSQARVVLSTTGAGEPLVLAGDIGSNGGHLAIWTTSAAGDWNNLPFVANFVPLVNETLFALAAGEARIHHRRLDAGQTLVWTGPPTPAVTSATLTRPDGSIKPLPPVVTLGKYVVTETDTSLPGLYQLHFTPPEIPQPVFYTVNISRAELDPATVSAADIEHLKESKYLKDRITIAGLPAALGTENRGLELWPYAALALLALLLLETAMTRRILRLQTPVGSAFQPIKPEGGPPGATASAARPGDGSASLPAVTNVHPINSLNPINLINSLHAPWLLGVASAHWTIQNRLPIWPAFSTWYLLPVFLLVGLLIWRLYAAQRQVASRRLVLALTTIRLLLLLLLFILLLQPVRRWTDTSSSAGTLWLMLDQSPSMAVTDPQATSIERLRWADALGYLKNTPRTSRLDLPLADVRWSRQSLQALRPSPDTPPAGKREEADRLRAFATSLQAWNDRLADAAAAIRRDPVGRTAGESIAKNLDSLHAQTRDFITRAQNSATLADAASDPFWESAESQLEFAIADLQRLADQADRNFLAAHAADPDVTQTLDLVAHATRADLAYQLLTTTAKRTPENLAAIIPAHRLRIVSFADGAHVIPNVDMSLLNDTYRMALATTGQSTDIAAGLQAIAEHTGLNEQASVILLTDAARMFPPTPPKPLASSRHAASMCTASSSAPARSPPTPPSNKSKPPTGSTKATPSAPPRSSASTASPGDSSKLPSPAAASFSTRSSSPPSPIPPPTIRPPSASPSPIRPRTPPPTNTPSTSKTFPAKSITTTTPRRSASPSRKTASPPCSSKTSRAGNGSFSRTIWPAIPAPNSKASSLPPPKSPTSPRRPTPRPRPTTPASTPPFPTLPKHGNPST